FEETVHRGRIAVGDGILAELQQPGEVQTRTTDGEQSAADACHRERLLETFPHQPDEDRRRRGQTSAGERRLSRRLIHSVLPRRSRWPPLTGCSNGRRVSSSQCSSAVSRCGATCRLSLATARWSYTAATRRMSGRSGLSQRPTTNDAPKSTSQGRPSPA